MSDSYCYICGGPDDSNNAEGPCLTCQIDRCAMETDRLIDELKEEWIARVGVAKKNRATFPPKRRKKRLGLLR